MGSSSDVMSSPLRPLKDCPAIPCDSGGVVNHDAPLTLPIVVMV